MVRLLIVEDDSDIVGPLVRALNTQGYLVAHSPDGLSALEKVKADPPDLLLLDLTLPGLNGFQVCESIRNQGLDFPIIMMTASVELNDLVHGLDCGADDYLQKPFNRSELFARIRAVSRRSLNLSDSAISVGNVTIDQRSRLCTVDGKLIGLTHTEFDLLAYLMRNHGRAVKRNLIVRELWNTNWPGPTKNLDMHISALRRKLGPGAEHLHTIRGLGFRFEQE